MLKEIIGYDGFYHIDECGNVHSSYRGGRILKNQCNEFGYMVVHLSKNGNAKTVPVHRLVATAFVPNKDNKPQVNHIDGDKCNNAAINLEWVSASENCAHRDAIIWKGDRKCGRRKTAVRCVETGEIFPSINMAAREYKTKASNIRLAIRGIKHHTAGHVHWEDAK